ncbi:MAG: lactoylglutathione lyase [Bdellovibrionota bacterium]
MKQFRQAVFISLPVTNLSTSIRFYEAIGFQQNSQFPDPEVAWMDLFDAFSVILITHDKWKEFTDRAIPDAKKVAQFGLSITKESKAAVNHTVETASQVGGKLDPNPIEEFECMYGRSIEDPDGHILELKWIDMHPQMNSNT